MGLALRYLVAGLFSIHNLIFKVEYLAFIHNETISSNQYYITTARQCSQTNLYLNQIQIMFTINLRRVQSNSKLYLGTICINNKFGQKHELKLFWILCQYYFKTV